LLADEGWTTVLPNPRGSTSYGIEFQQKIVGDWAGGDVRDIRAVIDSFVGRADLSAICLMGWSYGGYLAAWLACHVSELNAVIIGAPMTDLMLMESTTDIPEYCHYELGGPPGTRPEVYEARSPVNQIGDRMPRILLLHAAFDRRCPPLQSTLFSRRLAGRGQAVSLVVLPTDDHLLSGMHWWAERLRRTFGWLMSAVGQK
jgi:dipeptidyl aminopeptidase/acylaminoacyl peptidase